jgi:hypothetical protein
MHDCLLHVRIVIVFMSVFLVKLLSTMDTSDEKRQQIITLHQTGHYSNRNISQMLNIPRATVNRIISLWRQTGEVQSRRFGRPSTNSKLSTRTQYIRVLQNNLIPSIHLFLGYSPDFIFLTRQCTVPSI